MTNTTMSSTELDAILADTEQYLPTSDEIEARENEVYSVIHYSEPPSEEELSGILIDPRPKTYEEWVAIHGEPEYLHETQGQTDLDIVIVDSPEEPSTVTMDGIFYEDNKGKHLDYGAYSLKYKEFNNCVYCNGLFYSPDGVMNPALIRQDIAKNLIEAGVKDKIDSPTNSIFTTIKDVSAVNVLTASEHIIPFANGDLHIRDNTSWEFRLGEKRHTPYRLNVNYSNSNDSTPLFDKWLHDLFDESDLPTIQEMMGYMLVPTTSVQEAFILVGPGDAGKSVIGTILEQIFGNAFFSVNLKELVEKRFMLSTTENKLVVYDDDLGSAALEETGTLKKLVTGDSMIPGERKYGDPYNFKPYCKIIASANFMLSSLYDDSDGFFRRLHPIEVKPKEHNRKMIRKFGDKIADAEKEQIVRWALAGLKRLMDNGWKITWSDRSRNYMSVTKANQVHFQEFVNECFEQDSETATSTSDIRKVYERWAKANAIVPSSPRRMQNWLSQNATVNNMVHDDKIPVGNGKRVNGYRGVKIKDDWRNSVHL